MTEAQEIDLQSSVMPSVTIYSDGSYKPALGTGGYGSILVCGSYSKFCYGGFVGTSNNAMELMGVISALRELNRPCRVTIISDSQYVVKGINEYLTFWAANDWRKRDGGVIANCSLWQEIWSMCRVHMVSAAWIKGHAGNLSNAACDNFATIGAYKVAGSTIPNHLLSRL